MKTEKPILFNSEMVKAILEGRKTQTRRPFRFQPIEVSKDDMYPENNYFVFSEDAPKSWQEHDDIFELHPMRADQLWVRETFSDYGMTLDGEEIYAYKADDINFGHGVDDFKWTPSIHMPREASRINLKVKRVWVERIQDISEEDSIKEGIISYPHEWRSNEYPYKSIAYQATKKSEYRHTDAKGAFQDLWKSCGYEWESNPWVFACEFEVVK